MNKYIMTLLMFAFCVSMNAFSQKQPVPFTNLSHKIEGKVTDEKGQPLPGVTIMVEGKKLGTITDANGHYKLNDVLSNSILVFSFVGMETVSTEIRNQNEINVSMKESATSLNEFTAVGYGTMKKVDITGSIATINAEKLSIAPIASTTNTLAGQLPGLISQQPSGQPGSDAANLSIRGFGNALVIVDGVESSFNNIDPNEIESISILKDASAAIYGARAGNGVILVTTKRGIIEKPVISLDLSYTGQSITLMPHPVNAGEFATMQSESWLQAGNPPSLVPYTPDQIQKYYEGTDPTYPNTNWYNVLVRNWAPQQQDNLSIRGGNENIKFFGFLGYLTQGSMWKINGGNYTRYNLQSNIDAKIMKDLSLQWDISTIVDANESTWRPQSAGGNTVWQDFWNTLPIYPATLPDPTKISFANGGGTGGAQVTSNRNIAGYTNTNTQNIKTTISLNYNVSCIKGLSIKALGNVIEDYATYKQFTKPVNFYTYDPNSKIYTLAGALGSNASLQISKYYDYTITGQFSLNYAKDFGKNNHIDILGLYEVIDYYNDNLNASRVNFLTPTIDQMFAGSTNGMSNGGSAAEMGRESYVGRINYSFKNKYLVEATIRADASALFATNKRWGYFPSISLGWRINEEDFMQKYKNLDNLKIRISYGRSGLDNVGNFQYLAGYQYGLTNVFNGTAQQGIVSTGLANPNLTWENIQIYDFGTDFSFWNRKLYGTFDAFYRIETGIPATLITSLPSTFGATLPQENINSLNNRGFEFNVGTSGKIQNLFWDISGNISWSRAKWMHYEEPNYTDPDQIRLYQQSNKWIDRGFGYVAEGLFTSQAEINNLPYNQDQQGNVTLRPGDIKYKDVNGDGIINWKDQVQIGKGTIPDWMMGFNINLTYKNFFLTSLFQGAFGYNTYITWQHGWVQPIEMFNNRWTQTNDNPNALVPRLGGTGQDLLPSNFYYKDASYLRLKTFAFGYKIPKINGIKEFQVYISGTNILTFDGLKKYGIDPEAPAGMSGYYYPQQKTISVGIKASF